MSPRPRPPPILKFAMVPPSNPFAFCPRTLSPHVHFPPTPVISSTHTTHSSKAYDRTPLTVAPNICALPGRGERSYNDCDTSSPVESHSSESFKGSYFHPRAYEACQPETLPSLTYGSSESDESDGTIATPPLATPQVALSIPNLFDGISQSPIRRKCSREELENALAFIPYAPESSLEDRGRSNHHNSSPQPRRKSSDRRRPETNFIGCSSFAAPTLDGCLGGF